MRWLRRLLLITGILCCVGAVLIAVPFFYSAHQYKALSKEVHHANAIEQNENPSMALLDWNLLKKMNPDTVGWIQLEGTHIDYPVVQGTDNTEYLQKSFWGSFAWTGTPYLDARVTPTSRNRIIYGHYIGAAAAMFSELQQTRTAEGFQRLGKLYWYTPTKERETYVPVASLQVNEADGLAQQFSFAEDTGETTSPSYQAWCQELASGADVVAEDYLTRIRASQKAIILASCTSAQEGNPWRTLVLFVKEEGK